MKRLMMTLAVLLVVVACAGEGEVRIAVAPTKKGNGNVQPVHQNMVTDALQSYLSESYTVIPRTNEVNALLADFDFETSSVLTNDQKAKLAKVSNVDYICISQVSEYEGEMYISAKMLRKEDGVILNVVTQVGEGLKLSQIESACEKLTEKLSQQLGGGSSPASAGRVSIPSQGDRITVSVPGTSVSFEMVRVKAGSFTMGCTSEQSDCDNDETTHRVTLTEDFYMGIYEVTQELWEAVMGSNPSRFKGSDRPVESVSWDDAQAFCRELSSMTGKTFVLPTEAQWEYAARGGHLAPQQQPKYAGSFSVEAVAWYDGNSGNTTHPVGQKRANALGLYDMSGNVWEWCRDWYGSYGTSPQTEPTGPGSGSDRV